MDLKALMQKLEAINTTEIVTESVETKQVITESKTIVKESAEPVFKSSIARSLAEEFGYELEEADGASPWANDPAKDAAWKALSPEDQKWLGGADPTDPYILARAPNKGKPAAPAAGIGGASGADMDVATADAGAGQAASPAAPAMTAADQDDADLGAAMRANAAGGNSTSAATGVGIPGEEAGAQAAADKAAGATKWPVTPDEIKAFQKANGLTADGMIGKLTMAALQKAGATPPAGFTPVPNKAAGAAKPAPAASLGGKSFKDASAAANAAGGQAASPAAGPNQSDAETARLARQNAAAGGSKVADIDAQLEKYKKYPQSNAQIIARLEKEKAALGGGAPAGGQAASPAAAPAAKAAPAPGALGSGTFDPNAKAPGATTTSTNSSVQGNFKMGKPDGPIQYNGKNVNPGDPEYAAASQALIAAKAKTGQRESVIYGDEQSLVRIKSLAGL